MDTDWNGFVAENQREEEITIMAHRSHRGNGKSFIIGTVIGGLVGSVTALLFAPKSGDKMRKDVAKRYHNVSEKTQDLMEDVCDKAKVIAEDAKEAASSILKERRKRK